MKSHETKTKNLSKDRREQLFDLARKYNQQLASSNVKLTDPFAKKEGGFNFNYAEMLAVDSTEVMGTVEIPCIDVMLPIYHGTKQSTLEKGVGHLFGTSLPIGGKSTHSVITGHTGLSSAKLFTDLTEMKKGDLFYLQILSKNFAYRVDQILVVKPEDTSKLQIIDGEDHVTLLTCTPYGVNDHRLLVRGTRTKYVKSDHDHIQKRSQNSPWMQVYRKAIFIGLVILAVLWGVKRLYSKIKKKLRKETK